MRRRTRALLGWTLTLSLVFAFWLSGGVGPFAGLVHAAQENAPEPVTIADSEIYAQSAVLMDAASGACCIRRRGRSFAPMPALPRFSPCILALENCSQDDMVAVSEYAASMPDVQLNMNAGEYYGWGIFSTP